MIAVHGVSMRFGSKVLFDEVTTTFQVGRRYGLTGPNGAGKSTFMKLLTGEHAAAKGLRDPAGEARRPAPGPVRVRQLPRHRHRDHGQPAPLGRARGARRASIEKADLTDADGMRLGELEGIVGEEDGYTAESDAAILLDGLDIGDHLHERKMAELQGGQKVRVLLAQALFGHPQALLLDEPTNHLDLDSIHWLREFLVRYEGTLIVISHDRHFLNAVCTHIADIDYETIITYTGGYDDMVVAKTQIRSRIESDNAQREKKIAQLNDFIARFSRRHAREPGDVAPQGSRAPADDRAGALEHPASVHQVRDGAAVGPRRARVRGRRPRRTAISSVINGFDAIVNRGEKIVLVGRNGLGKTTLLKALLADAPNLSRVAGRHRRGHRPLGPRSLDRLLPAGSHRRDREGA